MRFLCALTALCICVVTDCRADNQPHSATSVLAGLSISSLGVGPEAGIRFTDCCGIRVGGNYLSVSHSATINDVDYDIDFRLASLGIIGDFYPFSNEFRISAGIRADFNKLTLRDDLPQYGIKLNGTAKFAPVGFYSGIGYETTISDDLPIVLALEIGVLFQGKPDVSLNASGPGTANPNLAAEVERQRSAVADHLAPLAFYPVIGLTLSYRF